MSKKIRCASRLETTPLRHAKSFRRQRFAVAACVAAVASPFARATTSTITTSSDHYTVNNGVISLQYYFSGTNAGKIMSITYAGQQMVGSKGIYSDIQGTPGIFLGSGETYTPVIGSNYIDLTAFHPATATEPLDVTWHYIIQDGVPGYSTYLTYNHTSAMADYASSENRLAQFFNENLFHYSSITDNYWGYQDAGDPSRAQGRWITAETEDVRGVPGEYIKNYETKYDWRTTLIQSNGVTGLLSATNTSAATRPLASTVYGVWDITNYRTNDSYDAGPTDPQSPWADGASFILCPAGSHQGGPQLTYTGNMTKSFGPFFTYFNTGTNISSMRANATQYATGSLANTLNAFYDSANLPLFTPASALGSVMGKIRLSDGTTLTSGATITLSTFDPVAYAADPIGQEYQRRNAGYNYWVTPNPDGTFTLPDVRPGTYRITVTEPGVYRETTFDNIVVTSSQTPLNVGNLTWTPDISGQGLFQVGTFDRTSGEFKNGNNYNNWVTTFDYKKDFPNGVNYTVNAANPFNDTTNWANNWALDQINGSQDFFNVNFNIPANQVPAANDTITINVAVAAEEFINDLAALIGNHRVDVSFDHTADNSSVTNRSGDSSARELWRTMTFPASWLHSGLNTITFHIVGGDMQWDAFRVDVNAPGTFSASQWKGGNGNWTDGSQWQTQQYGFTSVNKGTAGIANDTSTTFADGATATAPVNNNGTSNFYDAVINGGNVSLTSGVSVQKLSLLQGSLTISNGVTLTANDAFTFAGADVVGPGSIAALTTTFINFSNTLTNGGKIVSNGAVTWGDTGNVILADPSTRWTTPGLTFGQPGASGSLLVTNGATLSGNSNPIVVGTQGQITLTNAFLNASTFSTAGIFNSTGSIITLTSTFTNSGIASIDGGLSSVGVINTGGFLALNGSSPYSGNTSITGGTLQFASAASIGGTGPSVIVGIDGAVAFLPGITDSTFLSRLSTSSTGAFALSTNDAATTLDFTSGPLVAFASMGLTADGTLTYTGNYIPAGNLYRLGGGGGILNFTPAIAGSASVTIGNANTAGSVTLNSNNSYSGTTTLNGSTLVVQSLPNGGAPGNIGSSNNSATNLVFNGGTLQYAGPGNTTDRLFTITQNGATLDASGSGALTFSNTAAIVSSGSGNRTLTLTGNSTLSNTFAPGIADPSSGVTSLVKDGTNTWILGTGAKTYSGDTTISNGTLKLSTGASLPNGAGKGNLVVATNGTMELNGQLLLINGLNDGPAGAITSTNPTGWASPNGPGGGVVDNAGALVALNLGNNNATGIFSGVISGNINLAKNGTGTQTLSGDNTYSGTTTINAGTLVVGIGGTPSSTGPGDGGFRGMLGAGNIINNATLIYNRGYLTTVSNVIFGNGTLKQTANAELILGSANSYTGPTIIGGGIANIGLGGPSDGTGLAFTGDSSINASTLANGGVNSSIGASTSLASNLILDGGTLFYSSTTAVSTNRLFTITQNGGAIYTSGALTFNGAGAVAMTGTGNRTISLGGNSTASSTFGLSIGDPASGITSFTKDRSNTWIITSAAVLTYSGDTTLLAGTLQLGSGAALPFGSGKGNVVMPFNANNNDSTSTNDFSKLEMAGTNLQINALIGGTTAIVDNNSLTRTLTLGNNNAGGQYDGILTGSIAPTKTGSGTEIFTGNNTYTGTTTLNGGTLSVGNTTNLGSANNTIAFNGGTLQVTGTTFTAPARTITWGATGGGFDIATAGNIFTVSSNLSGGGLTKIGVGTLILSGSYTSTAPTVIISGNLQLNGTGTFSSGNLTNNASFIFNHTAPLTVNANISGTGGITQIGAATTTLNGAYSATGPITLTTGNLTFATSAAARNTAAVLLKTSNLSIASTSVLDVTNHDMIIGNSNLNTINNEILNGFGAGAGGASITSSTAISNGKTFLIPIDAAANGISSWDSVNVTDPNSMIVTYTYFGDATLDGTVDGNDFSVIAGNFGHTTPGTANIEQSWLSGDMNLDGFIDGNDFSVVAGNFGSAPLTTVSQTAFSPTNVPEPASLMLLGLGALTLATKKRRKLS